MIIDSTNLDLKVNTQLTLYKEENQAIENVWDKSVKVEQSNYYWRKDPIILYGKEQNIGINKPSVVELFCGCGGTSIGFEMAGFKTVLGCDILVPAIETFKYNHPNSATILGDIKKVKPEAIKEILGEKKLDVLIGGVPCQGFSINNRKRNEDDERNFMYKEFLKFVKILQPKAVVLENVSGMKSTGNFVETIEKNLSEAGGMIVKSKILFAPDYGVPQKRSRLVFVGVKNKDFDFNIIQKTHGSSTKIPYVTIRDAIGDLPSLDNGEEKK